MSSPLTLILSRQLQNDSGTTNNNTNSAADRGRNILTILYLLVLAFCFMSPFFYYCRIKYETRAERRLREQEAEGVRRAMERSSIGTNNANTSAETSASRRKYRDERKARIIQLIEPVKMTLTEQDFPVQETLPTLDLSLQNNTQMPNTDIETGNSCSDSASLESDNEDNDDDENLYITIPVAGLFLDRPAQTRRVPGRCTICLSKYAVGCDIVWSSNSACEHCFHERCIREWLLRQRDGPLCPCCRRDFLIDPFDIDSGHVQEETETVDETIVPVSIVNRDEQQQEPRQSELPSTYGVSSNVIRHYPEATHMLG